MPSCKTPLPESILTKTSDTILRDLATMSLAPRLIWEECWVVWKAFLMESDVRLPILWSSILGLPSQFLKLNFSLSHPENLISYIIHYRLTCPRANFTGKAPKPKFYSPGVTGRPYTYLACRVMSFLYKVIDIGSTMMPCKYKHLTRGMRLMVLITIIVCACTLLV